MADTATSTVDSLLSTRARRFGPARLGNPRNSASKISFLAGFPDPASLPREDIIESTRVSLEREGEWALQYGAAHGYSGLIDQLVRKLGRDQGIDVGPENILVTNGSSQALALIVEMLVDPGDVVLSEQPTWSGAVHNFTVAGADVRPIPIDDQGTDVDALERVLDDLKASGKRAKLFYVIPNFQNPTGVTTTLARRKRIVELARQHQFMIVEDDAYFDLRYAGERIPTLYALANDDLVMYLGTFSKIMAAGVRLGWCVASPDIINRLAGLKLEGGTSPFAGYVAAEFCSSGTLQEHIRELTSLYKVRRDIMLKALEREMPEGASWTTPEGGFFVWVTLPEGVSALKLLEQAKEQNVEFLPGTACHFAGAGDNTLRLSYSFASDEQIAPGIKVLADLIRQQQDAA